MIRPRLAIAPAPAVPAAVLLGAGVWAGSWSVSGEALAAILVVMTGAAIAIGRPGRFRAFSACVLAFQAGFFLGSAGIGGDRRREFTALGHLDASRPVRLTARLTGEWSEPGEGRHAAARTLSVAQGGGRWDFAVPAELWLDGMSAPTSGRGDVVEATGSLSAEDTPASPRDLDAPWRSLSLSCKSALEIRLVRRTPLSYAAAPARALRNRLFTCRRIKEQDRQALAALFFGDAASLDAGVVAMARRGGFVHWLTLSGLQAIVFLGGAWALLGGLGLSIRSRDAALFLLSLLLPVISGSPVSFSRVCLIAAVLFLSRLLERPVSLLQAVALAAMVIVLADPRQIFSAGYYLTMLPAVSAAVFGRPIFRRLSFLPRGVAASLAAFASASAAAFPLLAWRFNTANALGWAAAPLAIPATVLLVVSGGILLAGLAAGWVIVPAAAAFHAMVSGIASAAGWFAATRLLVVTPPLEACLAVLALLAAVSIRKLRRSVRWVAAATALLVGIWITFRRGPSLPTSAFSIEALDVGQGDAILLRSGRRAFLVDGGGTFRSDDEGFGRRRLLPKLLDRGVTRLDGVLLTHPHPDHALGLFAILRDLPVEKFYTGEGRDSGGFLRRLDGVCDERGVARRSLREGDRLAWGGGEFEVLRSGARSSKKDAINNESVVLLYEKNGRRLLLTGDAGQPSEQALLARDPPISRVDILKVGHHGSRTSSSPAFVGAVSPRAALISCGRHNRFGHPAPETLATFESLGIPVFRTDRRSDVGFIVTPAHLTLVQRGYP